MCDVNRVSWFLVAAKTAYLAMIALLVLAAVASGSIFGAGGAVGFMIGAILAAAASTGFFIAALADIGNCTGPCDSTLDGVRSWLIATIALMGTVTIMLGVLAIVAPVPVAGAVAITPAVAFLTFGIGIVLGIESMIATKLILAFGAFNSCQAAMSRPSTSAVGTLFAILGWIGVVAGAGVGVVAGGGLLGAGVIALTAAILYTFNISINVTYGDDSKKDDQNNP